MGRRVVRSSSQDMKRMLLAPAGGRFLRPIDSFDEVIPGVLLGDASTALSTQLLRQLKVTHVLNAAYGKNDFYCGGYVNTGKSYYEKYDIKFLGIPALDTPSFYLRSYFREAADFIADALKAKGKVLVHCQCGISRSTTLIAAYLMLKKKMDVQQALTTIRSQRSVFPNQGFLSQLCDLDYEMKRRGELTDSNTTGFEEGMPIKDSLKHSMHNDKNPKFTETNYFPIAAPLSRSGYPITSAFDNYTLETRSRARSEDRYHHTKSVYERDARSLSPAPVSYRTIRSSNVIPEALLYQDDKEYSPKPSSVRREYSRTSTSPILSSYDTTPRPYQNIYSHYTRVPPESFYYTPKRYSRPITDTYLKTRYVPERSTEGSLVRTLSPRDSSYYSARPYESYTYTSPYISRTFSTYTMPEDTTHYAVRRPRVYTSSPTDTIVLYPCSYVPSVLRSPGLISRSYHTRLYV